MSFKTFVLTVGVGLLAVMASSQLIDAQHENAVSKAAWVQTVCDQAHRELNGASEAECGAAQGETNTQYLCNSTLQHCWVEVK